MKSVSRMFSAHSTQAVLRTAATIPAAVGILWWLTTNTQPEAAKDHALQVLPEAVTRSVPQLWTESDGGGHATVFIMDSEESADRLRVSLQEGHAPSAWLTGYPALGEVLVAQDAADAARVAATLAECEPILAELSIPRVRFVQVSSQ